MYWADGEMVSPAVMFFFLAVETVSLTVQSPFIFLWHRLNYSVLVIQ